MATGKTTATTGSIANDSPKSDRKESQVKDVTDSKQNEVPENTTSRDEVELPTEEEKSKPDSFNVWCQKIVRDFEHIKEKDKLEDLKKRVIQAEEKFESIQEGYSIESRLNDTEKAIETLKKRLNITNQNSKNLHTNISVSQESVLQKFEEMYAQWNTNWSETDRASELCKIHEECYKFCKERLKDQMEKLLKVARPQSRNQSYKDNEEEQIIQEAYKELARNTVGTELVKVKGEGSKAIKFKPELKTFVPQCLEICWITLILKEPLWFEFDAQHAKEGTFEGTTQDKMAIVIKPAIRLDKDTIKIRGTVRQSGDAQTEGQSIDSVNVLAHV